MILYKKRYIPNVSSSHNIIYLIADTLNRVCSKYQRQQIRLIRSVDPRQHIQQKNEYTSCAPPSLQTTLSQPSYICVSQVVPVLKVLVTSVALTLDG